MSLTVGHSRASPRGLFDSTAGRPTGERSTPTFAAARNSSSPARRPRGTHFGFEAKRSCDASNGSPRVVSVTNGAWYVQSVGVVLAPQADGPSSRDSNASAGVSNSDSIGGSSAASTTQRSPVSTSGAVSMTSMVASGCLIERGSSHEIRVVVPRSRCPASASAARSSSSSSKNSGSIGDECDSSGSSRTSTFKTAGDRGDGAAASIGATSGGVGGGAGAAVAGGIGEER